jgi:cation:H+ antiporter
LGILIIFSKLLVTFSKDLALKLGISDWIIGSTIVAAGTSFPEFVTSLMASLKGKHSMSIGNILGSNIFNTCLVLGSASLISPMNVKKEAIFGSLLLVFLGVYLFFVGYKSKVLSRSYAFILLVLGIFSYFKILN